VLLLQLQQSTSDALSYQWCHDSRLSPLVSTGRYQRLRRSATVGSKERAGTGEPWRCPSTEQRREGQQLDAGHWLTNLFSVFGWCLHLPDQPWSVTVWEMLMTGSYQGLRSSAPAGSTQRPGACDARRSPTSYGAPRRAGQHSHLTVAGHERPIVLAWPHGLGPGAAIN